MLNDVLSSTGLKPFETECKWKERRLPEAAVFVDRELSRGLQEAEIWSQGCIPDHRIRTL